MKPLEEIPLKLLKEFMMELQEELPIKLLEEFATKIIWKFSWVSCGVAE